MYGVFLFHHPVYISKPIGLMYRELVYVLKRGDMKKEQVFIFLKLSLADTQHTIFFSTSSLMDAGTSWVMARQIFVQVYLSLAGCIVVYSALCACARIRFFFA